MVRYKPYIFFWAVVFLLVVATEMTSAGNSPAAYTYSASGYLSIKHDPQLYVGQLLNVGSDWQTVELPNSYDEMVVVASPAYTSSQLPAVVRIRNASDDSFEIRVQNPSDEVLTGYSVQFLVVEAGKYKQDEHGVTMEAVLEKVKKTDRSGSWNAESVDYENDYDIPVVVGQVMTFNDDRWSVFWSHGNSASSSPGSRDLYVGKHVGEDRNESRSEETIGYVVFESGTGVVDGYVYQALAGADAIRGMDGAPPYTYSHELEGNGFAVISQAGMDGTNGSWSVLWGSDPLQDGVIQLVIDEDQIGDDERVHSTEQVHALVFNEVKRVPEIYSFQPEEGPRGTVVEIIGQNFVEVEDVSFGGWSSQSYEVISDTRILATVPGTSNSGRIRVRNAAGLATTSEVFSVISTTIPGPLPGLNLCRLTNATMGQSSTNQPFAAAIKGCDGITDGNLEDESFTDTQVESEAWWEADLGSVYNLSEVAVWNRQDCCQQDLSDFYIFVSDVPFASKSVAVTLSDVSIAAYFIDQVDLFESIDVGRSGRYVRVQKQGTGSLVLAEVEIVSGAGNVVTGIEDFQVSDGLALDKAYPSPFQSQATITYHLPQTAHVYMSLFDVVGREVQVLQDGTKPAGTHQARLEARDLPNGVYFYRLESGERRSWSR